MFSSCRPFFKSPIAYFTAEFGLHESLPTYSGGLGILPGDHAKSASGLGLPFVRISLFYRQGYFQQLMAADGWQDENGIPVQWIEHIRRSRQTLIPQFNTDRMVAEYVTKYYLSRGKPSIEKKEK